MAADEGGERTEAPTPRRLQEAREEGRIPRSADLSAAVALLAGFALLKLFGDAMLADLLGLTRAIGGPPDVTIGGLVSWFARTALTTAKLVAPFLALLVILTTIGTLMQSGLALAPKRLTPRLSDLNPMRGLQRLFSTRSLARLGFGVLKMLCVGAVAYVTIQAQIGLVIATGVVESGGVLAVGRRVVAQLTLRIGLVLLLLGLLDYFYQRWTLSKSLRMTKQEVKDELRRMEGDPHVRARRRQIQTRLALQRIGIDVPKADVVVTNPTEFAVALLYDEATMSAPKVIAKGTDFLALRIRQVAAEHGIPIVQRPALARAVYAAVEVGHEVPPAFYRAVAEVLAYVYQLRGRAA